MRCSKVDVILRTRRWFSTRMPAAKSICSLLLQAPLIGCLTSVSTTFGHFFANTLHQCTVPGPRSIDRAGRRGLRTNANATRAGPAKRGYLRLLGMPHPTFRNLQRSWNVVLFTSSSKPSAFKGTLDTFSRNLALDDQRNE